MLFEEPTVYWLTAPKSLVYAMPESDAGLTQLPTEIYFLALEERGEIDESNVQILNQATELVNPLHGLLQGSRRLPQPVFLFHQVAAIHANASHEGDTLGKGLQAGFQGFVLCFERNGFANCRCHVGKKLFGLLERKIPRHLPLMRRKQGGQDPR